MKFCLRIGIVLFYSVQLIYPSDASAFSASTGPSIIDGIKAQIDSLTLDELRLKSTRSLLNQQFPDEHKKYLNQYLVARFNSLDSEKMRQEIEKQESIQQLKGQHDFLVDLLEAFVDTHVYQQKDTPVKTTNKISKLLYKISNGDLKSVAYELASDFKEDMPHEPVQFIESLPSSFEGYDTATKRLIKEHITEPIKSRLKDLVSHQLRELEVASAKAVTPERQCRVRRLLFDQANQEVGALAAMSPRDRMQKIHATVLNEDSERSPKLQKLMRISENFGIEDFQARSFSPEHICSGTSGSGKHYFENESELSASMIMPSAHDSIPVFINRQTGVILGKVYFSASGSPLSPLAFSGTPQESKKKISTIFPLGLTQDDFVAFTSSRMRGMHEYASGIRDDRQQIVSLYEFPVTGRQDLQGAAGCSSTVSPTFMVEAIAKNETGEVFLRSSPKPIVLDTFYPIFSYTKLPLDLDLSGDEQVIHLATMLDLTNELSVEENLAITTRELAQLLSQSAEERQCYVTNMHKADGNEVSIIDVGPFLADKGTLRGLRASIYIELPFIL
jgi:hypothetical protein